MEVDLIELHIGDVIDVVRRCEVDKVRYDEVKETDGLKRVHMLKAIQATPIQSEAIDAAFAEQQKRLEELQGVQQLDLDGDGEGEDDDVETPDGADNLADLADDASEGRAAS